MTMNQAKMLAGTILRKMGLLVSIRSVHNPFEPDMEKEFRTIYDQVKTYSMTPLSRLYALYKATQYVSDNKITGDIVECGVWRGGSMMVSALTLINMKDTSRMLYLYDTFAGMSKPTEKDVSILSSKKAMGVWEEMQEDGYNKWDYSPLEDVKQNIHSTKYPKDNIKFVKGMVEDTLPKTMPDKIAILRLDTDWYESTYHELVHLYPKLVVGGVLILDDYGHWGGVREAVDQYFKENNIPMLLYRTDYGCRIGVKVR